VRPHVAAYIAVALGTSQTVLAAVTARRDLRLGSRALSMGQSLRKT